MNLLNTPFSFVTARVATAGLVLALSGVALTGAAHAMADGHGRHGGGPGMSMMGGGQHLERMLDAVDASAEQRSQVKAIVDAARKDVRAQHEAGAGLRRQGMDLFTQPTVDARAAEALRQQMLAQHDAASKRMMQAMLDVSRVLSPEQRQKLGEQMKQRGAMMERHQRERATLDKPTK